MHHCFKDHGCESEISCSNDLLVLARLLGTWVKVGFYHAVTQVCFGRCMWHAQGCLSLSSLSYMRRGDSINPVLMRSLDKGGHGASAPEIGVFAATAWQGHMVFLVQMALSEDCGTLICLRMRVLGLHVVIIFVQTTPGGSLAAVCARRSGGSKKRFLRAAQHWGNGALQSGLSQKARCFYLQQTVKTASISMPNVAWVAHHAIVQYQCRMDGQYV